MVPAAPVEALFPTPGALGERASCGDRAEGPQSHQIVDRHGEGELPACDGDGVQRRRRDGDWPGLVRAQPVPHIAERRVPRLATLLPGGRRPAWWLPSTFVVTIGAALPTVLPGGAGRREHHVAGGAASRRERADAPVRGRAIRGLTPRRGASRSTLQIAASPCGAPCNGLQAPARPGRSSARRAMACPLLRDPPGEGP